LCSDFHDGVPFGLFSDRPQIQAKCLSETASSIFAKAFLRIKAYAIARNKNMRLKRISEGQSEGRGLAERVERGSSLGVWECLSENLESSSACNDESKNIYFSYLLKGGVS